MSIDMLRQQRHKRRLKKWITWAMMAEAFFIALSPSLATVALMAGILLTVWRFRTVKDVQFRHLPFDVPLALFVFLGAVSIAVSPN
ncbi:MAG: polymerase, partial [Selenomonadaceae bacterium]|nr:polymerase [Selenomonadaceae bacterium]